MRQMVVIGDAPSLTITDDDPGDGLPPVVSEGAVSSANRVYDEEHDYIRTATYDYGGRPTSMTLPIDPDWELLGGSGDAPEIGGTLEYDARGLPVRVSLVIDGSPRTIVDDIQYTRDGLVCQVTYGDDDEPGVGSRTPTVSTTEYDHCRRPTEFLTVRDPTSYGGSESRPLASVTTPMHQELVWDAASNLIQILDHRDATEWPDGYRPQSVDVVHDALYRVIDAEYTYSQDSGTGPDEGRDWRDDQATTIAVDPMRTEPAPMVPSLPSERVNSLLWEYDWLGNMQQWNDDAYSFYERSIGDIENGADRATHERPSALHFASNIRPSDTGVSLGVDRGGYVEVTYGENGNVVAMTVHGQCEDRDVSTACWDDHTEEGSDRGDHLRAQCVCATEQHYEYRWDEVNRLHEARRYDRDGGSTGTWSLAVRQRYRYDSANQRTVKQTIASSGSDPERIALYVYPGDYERRGLVVGSMGDTYEASTGLETETQYLVGGARVVWKHGDAVMGFDREQRITVRLADLVQTTAAVLDLNSGALLETSTYYPNGAGESYRAHDADPLAAEPAGFTGKEADDDVGVVYFGERYLISCIGRWASPDPLQVHAVGGGEAMNSYHYVTGSLLQRRDPLGLVADAEFRDVQEGDEEYTEVTIRMRYEVYGQRMWRESDESFARRIEENARQLQQQADRVYGPSASYTIEHEGREYRVSFAITVVAGGDAQAARLAADGDHEELERYAVANHLNVAIMSRDERRSDPVAGVFTSRAAPAANASPPGDVAEHRYFGSVTAFYQTPHRPKGNTITRHYAGAHEIGHGLNLGEGYGDYTIGTFPRSRAVYGTFPRDQGSIMGHGTDGGRAPVLIEHQRRAILGFALRARTDAPPVGFGSYRDGYRARELAPRCQPSSDSMWPTVSLRGVAVLAFALCVACTPGADPETVIDGRCTVSLSSCDAVQAAHNEMMHASRDSQASTLFCLLDPVASLPFWPARYSICRGEIAVTDPDGIMERHREEGVDAASLGVICVRLTPVRHLDGRPLARLVSCR